MVIHKYFTLGRSRVNLAIVIYIAKHFFLMINISNLMFYFFMYKISHYYGSVSVNDHTIEGLLKIFYSGNIGVKYVAMAMELLGPSLNELLTLCGNKLSLKTVLMIAIQMVGTNYVI